MVDRPDPHFSRVWYVSMFNVLLLSLPLGLLGWIPEWTTFAQWYSLFAFGFFLGPEWAAGGVRSGFSGTKTSWIFWNIPDRYIRVVLGVWMGIVMLWRLPEIPLYLDDIIGWGFLIWLPFHYISPGKTEGPFWDNVIWLLEKIHFDKAIEWLERKMQ